MKLFIEIIGDFHPLTVHFPIGIMAITFLLELLYFFRKIQISYEIRKILYLACFFSLLLAAFCGWLNAENQKFSGEDAILLERHEFFIYLAIITNLIANIFLIKQKTKTISQNKIPFVIFLLSCLFMSIGGHFGGVLVHGEVKLIRMFFTSNKKEAPKLLVQDDSQNEKEEKKKIQNESISFKNTIYPILQDKCFKCHGEEKQKGDLRLDQGKFIDVITPHHPEKSELFRLISLPEDHEDIMPPKKGPLSPEEIESIQKWILQGAKIDT